MSGGRGSKGDWGLVSPKSLLLQMWSPVSFQATLFSYFLLRHDLSFNVFYHRIICYGGGSNSNGNCYWCCSSL